MSSNLNSVRGVDSKISLTSKLEKFELFHSHNYIKNGLKYLVSQYIENVQFHYTVHEIDPLIDSSEMSIDKIHQILDVLKKNYHHFDFFIVIHGTDTMEHTSSAFSFLIKDLSKPIIFTGSQVPLLYVNNDAFNNFYNSLRALGCLNSEKPA